MNQRILEKKLLAMVEEDQGMWDVTAEFSPDKEAKAKITANVPCTISGIYELRILFSLFDIKVASSAQDGGEAKAGQEVFTLFGSARNILLVERTALNILSRMSGITSLTQEYVTAVAGSDVRVAATRKTTPGFAYFEKKAVLVGGGDTHRFGLYDMVLIKDNHLSLFAGVGEAVRAAKKHASFSHKIEIEVSNAADAVAAASEGADIVMLDNMSPEGVKETVASLKEKGLRDKVLLEASGGVTLKNIKDYAASGVDIISVGALTHSAGSMDFSLKIL